MRYLSKEPQDVSLNFTGLTADIVSAFFSNNPVPLGELPVLITRVHRAVSGLITAGGSDAAAPNAEAEKPSTARIRRSVRDDGIVSFIDGKTYKTLKRRLTSHRLDPRSYRERYDLPSDYPMVAPSYAEQRLQLAKAIGLGRPGGEAVCQAGGSQRDHEFRASAVTHCGRRRSASRTA
jgi:predicted transcriptional regulator